MKTVYLVRHAKSSWDNVGLKDIERPLNDRGLRDAPFMARLMREKGIHPNALITSPAVRAMATATYFKLELLVEGGDFIVRDDIYEASILEIVDLIQSLPDSYKSVMLFGHNPTFTSVANFFNSGAIDNMPTCSIVRIDSTSENWAGFEKNNSTVREFYYPKQYF